jgi:chromosome segregation ATPase
MKGKMLNMVLTVLVLVAFGVAMYRGISFYQEYKNKMASIEDQNNYIKSQLDDFSKNITELKDTLGGLDSRISKTGDMQSINDRLTSGENELKNATAQIDSIKKEVQDWQQGYSSRLEELQAKVSELKSSIEARGKATIDLGKVAIEKEKIEVQPVRSVQQTEEVTRGVSLQPR